MLPRPNRLRKKGKETDHETDIRSQQLDVSAFTGLTMSAYYAS